MQLELMLADRAGLAAAQDAVAAYHYLRAPVDARCSPVAYLVALAQEKVVGCLIFGRPESTRLLNMLPDAAVDDVVNGRLGDAVSLSDGTARDTLCCQYSDLPHMIGGQLGTAVLLSTSYELIVRALKPLAATLACALSKHFVGCLPRSAFCVPIGIVVPDGAEEEMPRIDTHGHVATVAYDQPIRDRAVGQFVDHAMRTLARAHRTIRVAVPVAPEVRTSPQPAPIFATRCVYLLPEAPNRGVVHRKPAFVWRASRTGLCYSCRRRATHPSLAATPAVRSSAGYSHARIIAQQCGKSQIRKAAWRSPRSIHLRAQRAAGGQQEALSL